MLANVLQTIGVAVELATDGRTKFNRHQLKVPKTHALDAMCVKPTRQLTSHAAEKVSSRKATRIATRECACTRSAGRLRPSWLATLPPRRRRPRCHPTVLVRLLRAQCCETAEAIVPLPALFP